MKITCGKMKYTIPICKEFPSSKLSVFQVSARQKKWMAWTRSQPKGGELQQNQNEILNSRKENHPQKLQ